LDGYDSLIEYENNNFYLEETLNKIGFTGNQDGMRVHLKETTVQHSRFCKGMLTYRKSPMIANELGFFNLTQQNQAASPKFV